MRITDSAWLLVAFVLLALPLSGQGAPVIVTATGVVNDVNDPDSLLPFGPLIVGTTQVSMSFTYEDSTSGGPLTSDIKLYNGAISTMSLTIGGTTLSPNSIDTSRILIFDDADRSAVDPDLPFLDQWFGTVEESGTLEIEKYNFSLVTLSATAPVAPLTSTDLVEPTWPSAWNRTLIGYQILDANDPEIVLASVSANIVPVPSAVWLFGSALGLLGWIRRKAA